MFDKPHKTGSSALSELDKLSLETRRHLHGLFEQYVEGLIILIFQILLIVTILPIVPRSASKGVGLFIWFIYLSFSAIWLLRPIIGIRTAIVKSFSQEELREAKTYERYCMGGWFLTTIGVLILATFVMAGLLYVLCNN